MRGGAPATGRRLANSLGLVDTFSLERVSPAMIVVVASELVAILLIWKIWQSVDFLFYRRRCPESADLGGVRRQSRAKGRERATQSSGGPDPACQRCLPGEMSNRPAGAPGTLFPIAASRGTACSSLSNSSRL
jgi:hypothetical protein